MQGISAGRRYETNKARPSWSSPTSRAAAVADKDGGLILINSKHTLAHAHTRQPAQPSIETDEAAQTIGYKLDPISP